MTEPARAGDARTQDRPDVSISIAHRNGRDMLLDCIASIYESTHDVSFEIIVTDNCSTDDSVEAVRRHFPDTVLVVNGTPRGYGASHNQGFAASRGRAFLVLNNDMLVKDGAIDAMYRRLQRGDGAGLVGCRLLNRDGSMQVSCATHSSLWRVACSDILPEALRFEALGMHEWLENWTHDTERDVDVVQGSCMMLPRSIVDDIGLFDEQYAFFREEFDLCTRVREAGHRVVFTPDGEIVHFGGATMKTDLGQRYREVIESRYRYFRKHSGPMTALGVVASGYIGVLIRAVKNGLASLVPGGSRAQHAADARRYASMLPWFFESARPWRGGVRLAG
jgi:hypothetical protein